MLVVQPIGFRLDSRTRGRRNPGMPRDGLTPLPASITAHLLRALQHVRHAPHCRLLLMPPASGRAPVWDKPKADYDVIWREQTVGRIWRFDYGHQGYGEGFPWHWDIRAADRKHESGHSLTLHEAMEHFRSAWDLLEPDQRTG